MKMLRYRIRVIALVLIIALLAVPLWSIRAFWFPSDMSQNISQDSFVSPSQSPAIPDASPALSEEPSVFPEETITPEPLFDTFGL